MAGTIVPHGQNDGQHHVGLNGVRPRWPEQSGAGRGGVQQVQVSMESGLDGRNNHGAEKPSRPQPSGVSMESGLDGRNNLQPIRNVMVRPLVSQWSPA